MLMIADLRHDLEQLQARVFPNSVRDNNNRALPRYSYYLLVKLFSELPILLMLGIYASCLFIF